jgi:ABC-2 type transport system ATP-binding protein
MRRRIDLAVTLILAPAVLFLDEPTTGLDPRNRNDVWEAVRRLVADGTTVLLTTQYLDEADQLADHISVMDRGRVIAAGPPDELKARVGGDRVEVVLADGVDADRVALVISGSVPRASAVHVDGRRVSVEVDDRVEGLTAVLHTLVAHDVAVNDIGLRRPTLDDVFLRLTGHRAEHTDPAPEPAPERHQELIA